MLDLRFVLCLLCIFSLASATYIEPSDARLAVELESNVAIHPSTGEPPFTDSITACFVDRVVNTGFTVVLPGGCELGGC